jgi:hypothetical protein
MATAESAEATRVATYKVKYPPCASAFGDLIWNQDSVTVQGALRATCTIGVWVFFYFHAGEQYVGTRSFATDKSWRFYRFTESAPAVAGGLTSVRVEVCIVDTGCREASYHR